MTNIYAKAAFLQQGFVENVRLVVEGGKITRMQTGVAAAPGDECHQYLLPGLDNIHSHAFQRAMSGLTERRGPGADSFWSWRNLMYSQALQLEPEEVGAIAAQAYMEMLEAGFTRVGEFHYLHHDKEGRSYTNIAEMAQHIAESAQRTGIGLTLLPVFYAHSGFGGAAPHDGQRRFINSLDNFAKLWQQCHDLMAALPGGKIGLAAHSLRAVTMSQLQHLLPLAAAKPVHIHIAEQIKEVEDCLAWSGARPVAWLLDHAPVDEHWTLIHATHINAQETALMAKSKAIAGLCPITEANLGDGIFPVMDFVEQQGELAIGSDSNIILSAVQELRQLEYSQRLIKHARNVIADPNQSTGLRLYQQSLCGGAKSISGTGHLDIGKSADFVTLKAESWADFGAETLLDQWIFGQGVWVDCVFVNGKKRVDAGRHLDHETISARFTHVMGKLRS